MDCAAQTHMSNPFNPLPTRSLEPTGVRRVKFKIGFYAALVTAGIFVTGMLLQGCYARRFGSAPPQHFGDAAISDTNSALDMAQELGTTPSPTNVVKTTPPPPGPASAVSNQAGVSTVSESPIAAPPDSGVTYLVKPGDTLLRIAKARRTTVKSIQVANGLKTDRINAGQKLAMPQQTN
jgi:LysM repeat protein